MGTGVTLVVCSPANRAVFKASALRRDPERSARRTCFYAFELSNKPRMADRSQLNRLGARTTCTAHCCCWKTTWLVSRIYNWLQFALRRVNSMDKPNGRLVLVSYTHYCASTSSLSTRWSSWALHSPFGLGDLILERASRLYAFSGYHNRTSLPSRAIDMTTGTQEVRPSRSSRTKDSPLQISYAHSR